MISRVNAGDWIVECVASLLLDLWISDLSNEDSSRDSSEDSEYSIQQLMIQHKSCKGDIGIDCLIQMATTEMIGVRGRLLATCHD